MESTKVQWIFIGGSARWDSVLDDDEYRNDIFVSNHRGGRICHFDLNRTRTELLLDEPLKKKAVDKLDEIEQQTFGQGFGAITNM
jgi:hypothetical protein